MKLQDLFEKTGDYRCQDPSTILQLPDTYPSNIQSFNCSDCFKMRSLKNAPKQINGEFKCEYCAALSNLIGASQEGVTNFKCKNCNHLTSLEGAPKKINGEFDCSNCYKLTNLIGAPQEGVLIFQCQFCNHLTSLEGLPPKLDFFDFNNTAIESLDYFEHNVCEIDEIEISNTVKTGLLNLLRIKNLKEIYLTKLPAPLKQICTILNSYLKGDVTARTILKARKELIDAGFKDYL